MAWKLGVAVFLLAALIMILGPMAMYVVAILIALTIVGLLLTLTVVSFFSPRKPKGSTGGASARTDDSATSTAVETDPPSQ